MNKNAFVRENITANIEAKTGSKLNQSSDVDIDESNGRNLLLLLILI